MANYTFDADAQGWGTAGGMAWNGLDGSPTLGCMLREGTAVFNTATTSITGLSVPVIVGDVLSIRYRVQFGPVEFSITGASLSAQGGGVLGNISSGNLASGGSVIDTGWQILNGTIDTAGTVDTLAFSVGSGLDEASITYAALDSVYVAESPAGLEQKRYLGIAADNGFLYVTSIQNGTLTWESSAITSLGIVAGSAAFGTAAYTDPDTYTRAIYPVVIADQQLYLYGRDGNNKQVQYNDLNGTLGWVDGGAGTAAWATDKFCVALMPQPFFPYSVIAAFADDDTYLTVSGSAGWVKQGDAGTVLRTAGRVTTEFSSILVAGQGTAQMYFSQNYGVSFTDALSGLAGTVNAIEVSR